MDVVPGERVDSGAALAGHAPSGAAAARLGEIAGAVGRALSAFIDRQRAVLPAAGDELAPGLAAIGELLATGKRLRPAFCYWGWRGAHAGGGHGDGGGTVGTGGGTEVITAAAALELLHAGALVHDDVIDASDTRRGRPSLHRRFAARHAAARWHGPPDAFGAGAAIVLGDLLLSWCDEMFCTSGLPADVVLRGQSVLSLMRTELMAGQYLDLVEQAGGAGTVASALRVADFKTAKYTIERPLQLGAALAGAGREVVTAYTRYGRPLGIAFQLRDDVLGVFGDPARTGKPAGDDLREGKRTVLVATTFARASATEAAALRRRLGDRGLDPAGLAEAREIIAGTGALAECEALIAQRVAEATAAIAAAPVTEAAKAALTGLAVSATTRAG